MAPKQKLVLDLLGLTDDFTLFGIACHARDYRFCWMMNQYLDINLRKIRDYFPAENGKGSPEYGYACFYAEEPFRDEQFYLLANRSAGKDLIEKYNAADYFLFVRDLAFPGGAAALLAEIKKVPQILTSFLISLDDFRDAEFLLEGLEFTRMQHESALREHKKQLTKLIFE